MKPHAFKDASLQIYDRVDRRHTFEMAAALEYYFVLALFPALILLSAMFARSVQSDTGSDGKFVAT